MQRTPTPRHYLMCRPDFYDVTYEINPWMDVTRPTDTARAVAQWEALRQAYLGWGHTVELIEAIPGLPDMVYAANGAMVVDGIVYSAKFRYPERTAEGPAFQKWFADRGYLTHTAAQINEGEGDILMAGGVILGGSGFRTDPAAHAELADLTGHEVITLELVDPRLYHLDTALTVLNGSADHPLIAYFPAAHAQLDRLTLTSRAFEHDQLGLFADRLAALVGPLLTPAPDGRRTLVLPMNTGVEAVETAIKAARKWGYDVRGVAPDAATIVVASGNFHGRTTTVISFSDDDDARRGFGPYTPGFRVVPYADAAALAAAIDDTTVAVVLEPVQGEAGVVVPPADYLPAVRAICDARLALH